MLVESVRSMVITRLTRVQSELYRTEMEQKKRQEDEELQAAFIRQLVDSGGGLAARSAWRMTKAKTAHTRLVSSVQRCSCKYSGNNQEKTERAGHMSNLHWSDLT